MELPTYSDKLGTVLQRLFVNDRDSYSILQGALYDWGNVLALCVGAVQLVAAVPSNLDETNVDILRDAEMWIEHLVRDMHAALGPAADSTGDENNRELTD